MVVVFWSLLCRKKAGDIVPAFPEWIRAFSNEPPILENLHVQPGLSGLPQGKETQASELFDEAREEAWCNSFLPPLVLNPLSLRDGWRNCRRRRKQDATVFFEPNQLHSPMKTRWMRFQRELRRFPGRFPR